MSRQDQYAVSMTIDNAPTGTWAKLTGGAVTSESTKHRPGAMAEAQSLGGPRSTENVVLSRNYKHARDHVGIVGLLEKVGKGQAVAVKQPLDIDGNAFGDPVIYRGTVIRVTPPDADSEGTDAAMLEVEIEVAGLPS